jgi:hypothetical protein
MLAPVIVDAIDNTLDGVLAHAAPVVARRLKARARIGQEVSERVVSRGLERVCEPPPTQRAFEYLTKSSAPGEGKLRDKIVNTSKIVAPLQHAEANHLIETILNRRQGRVQHVAPRQPFGPRG